MKYIAIVLSLLFLGGSITACNTMRGMGQDIEAGGEKIQDAAS